MHKTPAGQVAFGSQHAYAGYCDRAALLLQSEVKCVRSGHAALYMIQLLSRSVLKSLIILSGSSYY
jgi:hypothetical protein